MKKELKPKNGWRKSVIFSLRGKHAELQPAVPAHVGGTDSLALQTLLAGLTAFQRSWYYRAPLSSQFAEEIKQNKPREKQTVRSGLLSVRKVRSRLPVIPVRRSTLIDIIKSKRLLGEIVESGTPLPT